MANKTTNSRLALTPRQRYLQSVINAYQSALGFMAENTNAGSMTYKLKIANDFRYVNMGVRAEDIKAMFEKGIADAQAELAGS